MVLMDARILDDNVIGYLFNERVAIKVSNCVCQRDRVSLFEIWVGVCIDDTGHMQRVSDLVVSNLLLWLAPVDKGVEIRCVEGKHRLAP